LAQLNWTYTSDRGQQYVVGMYHGPQSGHFMVYCNSAIILIDFNVRKSSTYSFFIENELLELKINETDQNQFSYDFVVNTEAETPKNEERKRFDGLQFRWILAGLALFSLLVFGGYKIMDARNQRYLTANKTPLLQEKGLKTTARVVVDPLDDQHLKMTYAFIADGSPKEFEQDISLLSAGMLPVRSGDQFKITFLPQHPEIHELHLEQPNKKTLERFSELVLNKLMALHPQLNQKEADCLLRSTFAAEGTAGLANLFYQDLTEEEHPRHNYQTFQKMISSEDFVEKMKETCAGFKWE